VPVCPGGFGEVSRAAAAWANPERPAPILRKLPVLFVAAMLAVSTGVGPARSSVILSELCDPKNNPAYMTDRFIEIYNSGPDVVDLTGWSVVAVANNADACTWSLSGTIAVGQAKVCGYTTPSVPFVVNFPNASWNAFNSSGAAYNWNGNNDGAKLKNASGTVIDYVYAGAVALFTDSDMVRKSTVTSPNPVYTASEWTITPVLAATDGWRALDLMEEVRKRCPRPSRSTTCRPKATCGCSVP